MSWHAVFLDCLRLRYVALYLFMLIRLDEVDLAMDKESTTEETSLDTRNSNIIPPFVQILEYKLP